MPSDLPHHSQRLGLLDMPQEEVASTKVIVEREHVRIQDTEFISFTVQRTVACLFFVVAFTLLFLNGEE